MTVKSFEKTFYENMMLQIIVIVVIAIIDLISMQHKNQNQS